MEDALIQVVAPLPQRPWKWYECIQLPKQKYPTTQNYTWKQRWISTLNYAQKQNYTISESLEGRRKQHSSRKVVTTACRHSPRLWDNVFPFRQHSALQGNMAHPSSCHRIVIRCFDEMNINKLAQLTISFYPHSTQSWNPCFRAAFKQFSHFYQGCNGFKVGDHGRHLGHSSDFHTSWHHSVRATEKE